MTSFNENDMRVNKNCKYDASSKTGNSMPQGCHFLSHPVDKMLPLFLPLHHIKSELFYLVI